MICEYCQNTSGRKDTRGNCISCGAPLFEDNTMHYAGLIESVRQAGLKTADEIRKQFVVDDDWLWEKNDWDHQKILQNELLKLGYTTYDIIEIDSGFGSSRQLPGIVQRNGYIPATFKVKYDMGFPGGSMYITKIDGKAS